MTEPRITVVDGNNYNDLMESRRWKGFKNHLVDPIIEPVQKLRTRCVVTWVPIRTPLNNSLMGKQKTRAVKELPTSTKLSPAQAGLELFLVLFIYSFICPFACFRHLLLGTYSVSGTLINNYSGLSQSSQLFEAENILLSFNTGGIQFLNGLGTLSKVKLNDGIRGKPRCFEPIQSS